MMLQQPYLLFFLSIIITIDCKIIIGQINSAAYIPTNSPTVLSINGLCSECICFAFMLNNSSTYEALNCYVNNNTCLLFSSFSAVSNIRADTNSKLVFLRLSTDATTTTTSTTTTKTTSTTSTTTTTFNSNITTTTTTTTTAVACVPMYGQCGGIGWSGPTTCCAGLSCVHQQDYYWPCLTETNVSSTTVTTSSSTTISYDNITRENATTGSYWDCCKVSCGWPGKATVTSPAKTCYIDGVTAIDSNTASYCNGGNSYMCINQQPWNVSSNLSYGFAGAGIIGKSESNWCCACYSLLFTSGLAIGKEMIVQVINTAYPAGSMFVLQIPGSGWGTSNNGCPSQFNGSYSWGNQFGGVTSRSDCNYLPSVLQSGCFWRFDWLMNDNNATLSFKEVACPSVLTSITGCIRN